MFALELQRRSDAQGWPLTSVAAHPGLAATELQAGATGGVGLVGWLFEETGALVAQSAAEGAAPILYAATSPEARGGGYYGPDGWGELRGPPAPAEVAPQARDRAAAAKLWAVSEALTGVSPGSNG